MQVTWTLLANYADDAGGLLSIQGGGWDTVTVNAPLQNAPSNVFTVIRGYFVGRIAFHQTEVGRAHSFAAVIMDEDGAEVARAEGEVNVSKVAGLPPAWPQNVNLIVPLTGVPLPKPGQYTISLLVDGSHAADQPFRVIKGF